MNETTKEQKKEPAEIPELNATIDLDALSLVVRGVANVMPTKTHAPVLTHILLTLSHHRGALFLSARATDLDRTAVARVRLPASNTAGSAIPGSHTATWSACVNGALLKSAVLAGKGRPKIGGSVQLTVRAGDPRIALKTSAGTNLIPLLPASEFPAVPKLDEIIGAFQLDDLKGIGAEVGAFASTEASRPILNGILFQPAATGLLNVVATNGHRLLRRVVQVMNQTVKLSEPVIITPSTLALVPPGIATIEVGDSKNSQPWVRITGRDEYLGREIETLVIARTLEGPYPKYEQLIPTRARAGESEMRFVAADAIQAIKSVMHAASRETKRLVVKVAGRTVTVNASRDDAAAETTFKLTMAPSRTIAFGVNAEMLLDTLKSLSSEAPNIAFFFATADNALDFAPADDAGNVGAIRRALIMPLRLIDMPKGMSSSTASKSAKPVEAEAPEAHEEGENGHAKPVVVTAEMPVAQLHRFKIPVELECEAMDQYTAAHVIDALLNGRIRGQFPQITDVKLDMSQLAVVAA